MMIDFKHRQAAHCENGVTANLLRYYGIELSEPMAFGIGSGFFFSHMLFLKVNGMAVTSFRVWPGVIFKRVTKRLGISIKYRKFRDPDKAMQALDILLEKGIPVGMLVGVFHLPYFPKEYRFHFNAHNITVFGKDGDKYYVSDPVMENIETLTGAELRKVRFAKGTVPPRGKMYYITSVPDKFDLKLAIIKGIRKTADDMINIPLHMFGVRGIRYLAGKMRKWPLKLGIKSAVMNLGQVIRMLEEIGTGGAGFRFIYAAFLQESAGILQLPELNKLSTEMTEAGDKWREFAWQASRCFKNRDNGEVSYDMLADILMDIAAREEKIFRQLSKLKFE
ncbi:MAG: BtrH N-terminal domain-containing protein [Bacteroidales bacterium]|nr:BtrH N-terminal domain-containing protein [Bacteroidales bacterium]